MAASNRDLEADAAEGDFRRDLFFRLSVVTLNVPTLRERVEDIPALVESYISYFGARIGSSAVGIAPGALDSLRSYAWPGNVRELINIIERAMLLCENAEISNADLPHAVVEASSGISSVVSGADSVPEEWLDRPLADVRREVLDGFERAYLTGLLRATAGRVGETARRAGIEPRSLYDKMKRYGLRKEDFSRGGRRR